MYYFNEISKALAAECIGKRKKKVVGFIISINKIMQIQNTEELIKYSE